MRGLPRITCYLLVEEDGDDSGDLAIEVEGEAAHKSSNVVRHAIHHRDGRRGVPGRSASVGEAKESLGTESAARDEDTNVK